MPRYAVQAALAALLAAGACSPSMHGSADMDFLWVRTDAEGRAPEGGISHATLRVEKSRSGMAVGVFESKPGGTGEMWRSAIWIAALTGTLNVGKNPLDYKYSVETETLSGRVDGPSAGGLFAVGVMAALTGRSIAPGATMTGTVNPDGTIGPVGGISQKLTAARTKDKTRFCYPVGQQYEEDEATGNAVDIADLARKAGMEAVEVEDLRQAFLCLTGEPLRPIEPVRRSEMALSGPMYDKVHSRAESWLKRCQEAYAYAQKLKKADWLESLWTEAGKEYDDASALLKQGLVAAAYWRAVSAYASARTIVLVAAMMNPLSNGDPVESLKVFPAVEEQASKGLDQLFGRLSQSPPDNVSRTIAILDSYEAAISAVVSREVARAQYGDIIKQIKEAMEKGADPKEIASHFSQLHRPLAEVALMEVNADLAFDNLKFMEIQSGSRAARLSRVDEVAHLFQGAASANIEYFNAIFVAEVAARSGQPEDQVSAVLLDKEPNYRAAQFNLKLPESGKMGYAQTGQPASLAKLAGALSSFFASSTLVAKFYSIGVRLDDTGATVGVEREKALIASLSLAEEKARESAAVALKHAGEIPESARVTYQIAMVLRERPSYEDKLMALEQFWRSSVWSQVAVFLARLEKEETNK
jgi:hypothetical protein